MKLKNIQFCILALMLSTGQANSQAIQLKGSDLDPQFLVDLNGTLLFQGGPNNANQLWKSDGTEEGTVLLKSINVDLSYGSYAISDNTLFFSANDGSLGYELWKTDGTEAGTVLVKDIFPGSGSGGPRNMVIIDKVLYFSGSDGIYGQELWKSDGTSSGTVLVKDIYVGWESSSPDILSTIDGTLYFVAKDASHGYEFWKSDGTSGGTVMVKDINPGTGSSSPREIVNKDGVAYFFANDGLRGYVLWKSDGTTTGTKMVKNLSVINSESTMSYLININGTLFFSGTDLVYGSELWKSDGTENGTVMLKDINPSLQSSDPTYFVEFEGKLIFEANDLVNGRELWKSDGTSEGTELVKDINPGYLWGSPQIFEKGTSSIYICATSQTVRDLWKTDGTTDGTYLMYDLFPGGSSTIYGIKKSGNFLYFIGDDYTNNNTLWRFDLTPIDQTIQFDQLDSKTYGDSDFDVTATATSNLKVCFSSSNTDVATVSGSQITIVGAGSATISAYQKGDDLYNPAKTVQHKLVVEKADLSSTADDKIRHKGDHNPEFTISYSGFVNGDSESDIDITPDVSCNATVGSPAGNYDIILSGGSDNNYNLIKYNGTLTVTRIYQTITFVPFNSKTYGDVDFNINATASSGLNLTFSSSNTDVATVSGSKITIVGAGSAEIKAYQKGDDLYFPSEFVEHELIVEKADLIVSADDKIRQKGESNPVFTLSYSGFVNGDSDSDIDIIPNVSCIATVGSPAGNYDINLSGGSDNNYNLIKYNGTLTVTRIYQTITFVPFNSKTYSDVDFNITATASSGLNLTFSSSNTDVATVSGSKITIVGAGSAEIKAYQQGDDLYFPAEFVEHELIVEKADLIVSADDKIRQKGEPNPVFTLSYSGFVKGDSDSDIDIIPNMFCIATAASPTGNYDIILSGGSDNNYNLIKHNGTLTVSSLTNVTESTKDNIKIYPNPAHLFIKLIIESIDFNNLRFQLYDLNGKLLMDKKIERMETEISIENLESSVFLLKVVKNNLDIKVFKIFKK